MTYIHQLYSRRKVMSTKNKYVHNSTKSTEAQRKLYNGPRRKENCHQELDVFLPIKYENWPNGSTKGIDSTSPHQECHLCWLFELSNNRIIMFTYNAAKFNDTNIRSFFCHRLDSLQHAQYNLVFLYLHEREVEWTYQFVKKWRSHTDCPPNCRFLKTKNINNLNLLFSQSK
jgi:hypothetical protein